jgi:hypothetical protein
MVLGFYAASLHRLPDPLDSRWLGELAAGRSASLVEADILDDPFSLEFFHDAQAGLD